MKKYITSTPEQLLRVGYMDRIDKLLADTQQYKLIEEILDRHNASEDDSDPDEGYYVTMTASDLRAAYDEIVSQLNRQGNPEIYYYTLRNQSKLSEFEEGWLAGYEAHRDSHM